MSKYIINVKNGLQEYESHDVAVNIYLYIKQLECAIKFPEQSMIKELYPERFTDKDPHGVCETFL